MYSLLITFTLYATAVLSQTIYDDWEEALEVLTTQKAAWLTNGVTSYVYNFELSAFIFVCITAPKYIIIDNRSATSHGRPIYVEFDQEYLAANPQVAQQCLPHHWITSPLTDNFEFQTIDYYYDEAIAHAQKGINANCSTNNRTEIELDGWEYFEDMICGGHIAFDYDNTYHHPTYLQYEYGPFIADAGRAWRFKCFTSITDDGSVAASGYSGECSSFTLPALGDECGTPGIDCPELECVDGVSDTDGCCGECVLEETNLGEMLCQTQETECSDNICGTIQRLICPIGFICEDDPSDDCELGVDSNCAGICVEGADITTTPPNDAAIADEGEDDELVNDLSDSGDSGPIITGKRPCEATSKSTKKMSRSRRSKTKKTTKSKNSK